MGSSNAKEEARSMPTPQANRKEHSVSMQLPIEQQLVTESNQPVNTRSNRHSKIKKAKDMPSQKQFKTVDTADEVQVVVPQYKSPKQNQSMEVEVEEMDEQHPAAETLPVRRNKKFRPSSLAES